MVEQHHGDAHHALAVQTGTAAIQYLFASLPGGCEVLEPDGYASPMARHEEKNDATHYLTDNRSDGGSDDAKVADEDQQGVEDHVEYGSCDNSHHGVGGIALQTELIVQGQ